MQWAEALWQHGLASELITPLPSIGMRAWRLSGNLLAWSALVGEGVREGWLPWQEPEPRSESRSPSRSFEGSLAAWISSMHRGCLAVCCFPITIDKGDFT